MKYMLEYRTRNAGLDHAQNLDNTEALLTAFSKWAPEPGLNILAFVGKLTGNAGYLLVEADDPKPVATLCAKYLAWNEVRVVPVVDIEEIVAIDTEAIAWARAASGA